MKVFKIVLCAVFFAVPAYAQCVIGWSNDAADLPIARIRGGGGVYDGQLYVFAGYDSNTSSYLADTQIYDPAADSWTAGAAAPVATSDSGYTVAPEGYGYIVGGGTESITFTNAVHQYDIETDSWTTLSYTYPLPVWNPACAAPGDGYVYCFGGTTDSVYGRIFAAKYEIGSDDPWTAIADLPSGKMFGEAIAMDGMIYIVGGWSAADTAYAYDPDSDSYTTLDTLTTGRQRPSIVAAGGLLWVAGGGNKWTPIGSAEYFDGTSWTDAGASMDVPVLGGIAGYLHGYGMFLAGGRNSAYSDTTHNQLLQVCVPAFDSIAPAEGQPGDAVTIAGAAFAADVDVVFFDATAKAEYPLENLTVVDAETITGDVPAGLVVGVYGLRFTGALGQLEEVENVFEVPIPGDDDTADDDTADDDTADDDTIDDDTMDDDTADDDTIDDDTADDDTIDDDTADDDTADDDTIDDDTMDDDTADDDAVDDDIDDDDDDDVDDAVDDDDDDDGCCGC